MKLLVITMFWNQKKKGLSDAERVARIRESLSDYVSDGEKTQFDITTPLKGDRDVTVGDHGGTIEFNNVDFQKYNVARINYDVTEWEDITLVPRDLQGALQTIIDLKEDEVDTTITDITEDQTTDYWATKA